MSNIIFQPSVTTHWRNLFESKSMLLGSHNLNEGEELVCEISNTGIQTIKNKNGKDENVPVILFTNAPPMVLNITNTKTIAALYGDLYDKWVGRSIQVYATKVKAFGSVTMALRVRPVIPANSSDTKQYVDKLNQCGSIEQLKQVFMALPNNVKPELSSLKDTIKAQLEQRQ